MQICITSDFDATTHCPESLQLCSEAKLLGFAIFILRSVPPVTQTVRVMKTLLILVLLPGSLYATEGQPPATVSEWFFLAISLLGGLALFLYGMQKMSDGLKKSAGQRMRSILAKLTTNRIVGLTVGIFVTTVIQSSSATTVMLVSFVQAELMTFGQSLGVILGAGIGTTITAQLVAFKLTDYAMLMVAAGFMLTMLGRKENLKYVGEAILGFGILFFGMKFMGDTMGSLKELAGFRGLLVGLENPLLGLLTGAIFTALIQSSSAFTGIIIVLAQQNLITLEAGIPLVLGANIGTCITALLASIGTSREARRVALAHIVFKIGGVILFIFWIPQFADLIRSLTGGFGTGTARQIANAHTFFNIILVLFFLPFIPFISRLLFRLLPSELRDARLQPSISYLDRELISNPALALDLARSEVARMMLIIHRMLDAIIQPFVNGAGARDRHFPELTLLQGIHMREQKVDFLDEHITDYLSSISRQQLTSVQSLEVFGLLSIVKDLESIGDIVEKNLMPLVRKKQGLRADFSQVGRKELQEFHLKIVKQIARCEEAFGNLDPGRARRVLDKEVQYAELESELRQTHFERICEDVSRSVATHEIHLELMDLLNQINVHTAGVARTILKSCANRRPPGTKSSG